MAKGDRVVTEIVKEYIRCRRVARMLRTKRDYNGAERLKSMADAYFHSAKIAAS
jgi:hypothetical protein